MSCAPHVPARARVFTSPTYSTRHKVPADEIVCVSVNDPFVMGAWAKDQGAEGKVRCLADPQAELAKALGLDVNLAVLGGTRVKRFSALVEDGKITKLNVEPEAGTGLTCSLADPLLAELK